MSHTCRPDRPDAAEPGLGWVAGESFASHLYSFGEGTIDKQKVEVRKPQGEGWRPTGRWSKRILDLGHKEEKSFKEKASGLNELISERGNGS